MVVEIDLKKSNDNLEVQLGYLCNHLERGNKAVNTEIENLLKLSHDGIIFGTTDGNQRKIEHICYSCKMLLETQIQLISVIEPTLSQLNFNLKRGNSK